MTRASLWGIALCGALIGAGLVLILTSLRGADPNPADGAQASKPPQAGASTGIPKSHFIAHVRPVAKWDAAEPFDVALAWRRMQALMSLSSLHIEGRLIRELRSGHAFEAELMLDYDKKEDREVATLTLPRENGTSIRYRAELRDGVIAAVQVEEKGVDGEVQLVELPAATLDQVEGGRLPIGIGDLSIRESVDLLHALRTGNWRILGDLDKLGSRSLIVFEVDLEGRKGPVRGQSALAYVDVARWELHSLRVFDDQDRLVRIYGDFAYQDAVEGRRLSAFRVSTIPSGSHSVFQLERMKLGD